MRVIVTSMTWMRLSDLTPVQAYLWQNRLTFVARKTGYKDPPPIRFFSLTTDWLGIPRPAFLKYKAEFLGGIDIIEDTSRLPLQTECLISDTRSNLTLRDDQERAVSFLLEYCKGKEYSHQILEAYTSFGKTVSMLELIRRLGQRAIVLVHRMALAEQWQERCSQFFPDWETGIIGDGRVEWLGRDVVFASMQSLMKDRALKMPNEFWKYFSTCVVDECHVLGAAAFASVAPRFSARWQFGVSGTVRRLDKMEPLFRAQLGDVAYKAEETNRIYPKVIVRGTCIPMDLKYVNATKIEALGELESETERQKEIAQDVLAVLAEGRNPLIMGERLEILRSIAIWIDKLCVERGIPKHSHGFYIGGLDKRERDIAAQQQIVYATTQLAKEGIDVPRLDTLFLTTPRSDVEQECGRVVRAFPDKKQSLVYDYVDFNIEICASSFNSRLRMYRKLNWDVSGIEEARRR